MLIKFPHHFSKPVYKDLLSFFLRSSTCFKCKSSSVVAVVVFLPKLFDLFGKWRWDWLTHSAAARDAFFASAEIIKKCRKRRICWRDHFANWKITFESIRLTLASFDFSGLPFWLRFSNVLFVQNHLLFKSFAASLIINPSMKFSIERLNLWNSLKISSFLKVKCPSERLESKFQRWRQITRSLDFSLRRKLRDFLSRQICPINDAQLVHAAQKWASLDLHGSMH